MSRDALIGHTGFVGGSLLRSRPFVATFNSSNIESIDRQHFDTIVCAGVSAVKWLANKEPDRDWQGIQRLMRALATVTAGRFVLISTIDVYRDPVGLTEEDTPPTDGLHAYGLHRLKLEAFVREHFPVSTIVRLPALFGTGLKKNALYDLIHRNQTDKIVPDSAFQWYPTRRLHHDLHRIVAADIDLINITAEPIDMATVQHRFFPDVPIGQRTANSSRYDIRSIHDGLLNGRNGYHLARDEVFEEMSMFFADAMTGSR